MPDRPLVSIVTPTLNQGRFIEATLRSVRAQTYLRVEHVVVDGGSVDGTLDILRAAGDVGDVRWISEPDAGLYDAVNKGVGMTSGEIVAYLNSDDALFPWAVESVVAVFERRPDVDVVFGDGVKVDEESGAQHVRLFPAFDRARLAQYESLMQPAVFARRRLFDRIGGFDTRLRYVADLDAWLRASEAGATITHVDEMLAVERIHPGRLSSAQAEAMAEEDRAMRATHAGPVDRSADRARTRAKGRHGALLRLSWLRFLVAAAVRRKNGPWPRFLAQGGVTLSVRKILSGQLPGRVGRFRMAARSRLAAELLEAPSRPVARSGSQHGHSLLLALLPAAVLRAGRGHLIEIGSTREKLPGQGSTVLLATAAMELGLPFITVDMDPANTEQARRDLAGIDGAEAITARGEDYLASFDRPVVAAYLDAFDIQHGMHSDYRVERYREFLGTDITNEAASAMHLACASALLAHVVPGGLIVIDDTWLEGTGFAGKGSTAVPMLLAHGFAIVGQTKTAVALQRPMQTAT